MFSRVSDVCNLLALFSNFIYLIYLAVPGLSGSTWSLGSSLWHVGSLAVACELLVATCGIQFPDQGSNPGPLHWECGVLATGSPGKFLSASFMACTVLDFHFSQELLLGDELLILNLEKLSVWQTHMTFLDAEQVCIGACSFCSVFNIMSYALSKPVRNFSSLRLEVLILRNTIQLTCSIMKLSLSLTSREAFSLS